VFETPKDTYTKALLLCRPQLDRRPTRLPVIDDFIHGTGPQHMEDRRRGVRPSDPIVLDVKNLGKSFFSREGLFGKREFKAVKNVSFQLPKGKTLGLVGESGSGKTTVGLTLMRLHEATTGEAFFEGRDLLSMSPQDFMAYKRRIQIIFQNPYASLNPRFTVGQIVVEPMSIHGIGKSAQERTDMAFELLNKVGLPEVSFYKYPHEFSGGQRQRIGIARAMVLNPDLVIADEPVSALDVSVQAQVINLLEDLQEMLGLTYLVIAHDLAVVRHVSDRVGVMYLGGLVEEAPSQALYDEPLHPYTRALLSAIPVPDPELEDRRERILLTGDLPSPAAPPPGCRFHTRCPWRQPERCDTERPQLRVIEGAAEGHRVACHYAEQIRSGRLQPHAVEATATDDVLGPGAVPDQPGSVTEILGR